MIAGFNIYISESEKVFCGNPVLYISHTNNKNRGENDIKS